MSTDYRIICKKCKKELGFSFSRQAWGWGNANIIRTFQFLMKHTAHCGEEHLSIVSEDFDSNEYGRDCNEELLSYFPHSYEWRPEISDKEYEKHKEYKNKQREKDN